MTFTDKFTNLSVETKTKHLKQNEEYVDSLYEKPDLRQLFIEMTLNCNEHCRHCGSRCGDLKMEDQLTDKEIIDFLTDLKGKVEKLPFLNITGGEPTLRPNFIELMHEISELGYKWGMTTNGTLITESYVERLKYAGMSTVSVSIDGLESTHNWFRQVSNGYKKSIDAIKYLVNGGFYNVMVTTVVHSRNINELYDLYKIVKSLGVDTWRVINIDPIGRAKDNPDLLLNDNQYMQMLDFIKARRASDKDIEVCFGCNYWLGTDNEHRLRNWYYKCTAGIQTGGIFYNGDIGGCLDIIRTPDTIQGNIRNNDFLTVWNNKFSIFRKNRAFESDYCKDCIECKNCRGHGFHTWNIIENKPEICMYKIYNGVE